jgi:HAD superfamily hydrolase (TIGR01549 family)
MTSCAVFDFADTLAELRPSSCEVIATYIERACGIRVNLDSIARASKMMDLLMPYSSVRTITRKERADFYLMYNQQLFSLLGVTHRADPAGLFDVFDETKPLWELKQGVVELLGSLREMDFRIGIISNFDHRLKQIVHDRFNLAGTVDYLHVSQSEGVEKPDPRFFRGFFERHGLDAAKAFYTGDSYLLDFLPATRFGLKSWLLDEYGNYPHLPEAIRSLNEIILRIRI